MGEQKVAQDVTWLEPIENGVRLSTFFKEPQVVQGCIQHIDFLKHRVLLEPTEEKQNERD
jgi:predicted RNA-binding protein